MSDNYVITCVYCGQEYPSGTPTSGAPILTEHIKVCDKHPMRKLRNALVGLIGADGRAELKQMELAIRVSPVADRDKAVALNAVHALLETLP